MENFSFDAWSSEERPTHYTYKTVGVSKNALKVVRSDRAKPQTFSKKTFNSLKEEGRLTIIDRLTFQVEIDQEWNPDSQFDSLD
jgi:hypothetical protein